MAAALCMRWRRTPERILSARRLPLPLLALLLSALLALGGCAGSGPGSTPSPGEPVSPTEPGELFTVRDGALDSSVRGDFEAALALLERGEYDRAIPLLEAVTERAPKALAPQVNLAIAYSRLERWELAEDRFEQALALNPEHPVVNNEYGIVLRKQGRFSEARALYEKALAAYPQFYPAVKNLGILCDLYMGDLQCALDNYQAYARRVPGDEEVELWVVDLKRRMGN